MIIYFNMPKAGLGGNKRRKGKKQVQEERELRFKDTGEEYAQVTKLLGDCRVECLCADGKKRVAHVRGKMRKRIYIANNDIILVSLREFEDDKCDVVEKYKEKEISKLKKEGELPESMVLPSKDGEEGQVDDVGGVEFEEKEKEKVEKNNGFEFEYNEEEDEEEEDEEKKDKKEDKKDEEKEDKKEENEDKKEENVDEEDEQEEEKQTKEKMSKKQKKDKEKKIKKKRDDKKKEKADDEEEGVINIDNI